MLANSGQHWPESCWQTSFTVTRKSGLTRPVTYFRTFILKRKSPGSPSTWGSPVEKKEKLCLKELVSNAEEKHIKHERFAAYILKEKAS